MAWSPRVFLMVIASAAVLQVTAGSYVDANSLSCVNKTLSSWNWRRYSEDVGAIVTQLTVNVEHYDHAHYCTRGHGFGYIGTEVWVDHGCRAQFTLCTVEGEPLVVPTKPTEATPCDQGWTFDDYGSCYKLADDMLRFADASSKCAEEGAMLADSDNEWHNAYLAKFVPSSDHVVWLNTKYQNGEWTWLDNGKTITFNKWKDGEHFKPSEQCAALRRDGMWMPLPCYFPANYLCVKDATEVGPGY